MPISGAPAYPALSKKKSFSALSKKPSSTASSIEDFEHGALSAVEGIEFRAITVTAYKGKEGPCIERNQAVIYRGPWKQVVDDDGHTLERGARTAVCDKTFKLYSQPPYAGQFILVAAAAGNCHGKRRGVRLRARSQAPPRETKGAEFKVTALSSSVCGPGSSCCA